MFIDKDSWGRFSINDLSERDLRLFYEALRIYAQKPIWDAFTRRTMCASLVSPVNSFRL